jgi:hypothetical protein
MLTVDAALIAAVADVVVRSGISNLYSIINLSFGFDVRCFGAEAWKIARFTTKRASPPET